MKIKLILHGVLRDYLPHKAKGKTTLSLPNEATVENAIHQLQIKATISASINGTQVETDRMLHDGDELQLFRPIGGG